MAQFKPRYIIFIVFFIFIFLLGVILTAPVGILLKTNDNFKNTMTNILQSVGLIQPNKIDKFDFPIWDPLKNNKDYTSYHYNGPEFIGINSKGEKVILFYTGIVKKFDTSTKKVTIEYNKKSETTDSIDNFLIIVYEPQSGIKGGVFEDILVGKTIKVGRGLSGNLEVFIGARIDKNRL